MLIEGIPLCPPGGVTSAGGCSLQFWCQELLPYGVVHHTLWPTLSSSLTVDSSFRFGQPCCQLLPSPSLTVEDRLALVSHAVLLKVASCWSVPKHCLLSTGKKYIPYLIMLSSLVQGGEGNDVDGTGQL